MNVDFLNKQQLGVDDLVSQAKDRSSDAIERMKAMNANMEEAKVTMSESNKRLEGISVKLKSSEWLKKK
jgi:hypothetical protein